jgi:hypothetical protein
MAEQASPRPRPARIPAPTPKQLQEGMSLEALAEAIQVDASDIVRSLFMKGIMLSMNQVGCGGGGGEGGEGGRWEAPGTLPGQIGAACASGGAGRPLTVPRPAPLRPPPPQVLDKNTVKLVAAEYDLLVVDKEEAGVTDAARKRSEWLDVEDLDDAVPRPPVVRDRALDLTGGLTGAWPGLDRG